MSELSDSLNPATVAALGRALEEIATQADRVSQAFAGIQGGGGGSGARSDSSLTSKLATSLDRQTSLLASILAATERNTAAIRLSSVASVASAVSSVRSGGASGMSSGRSSLSSEIIESASETAVRKRVMSAQEIRNRQEGAEKAKQTKRNKEDAAADALHLRTQEEGDDLALRKAGGVPTPGTAETPAAAAAKKEHRESPQKPGETDEDYAKRIERNRKDRERTAKKGAQKLADAEAREAAEKGGGAGGGGTFDSAALVAAIKANVDALKRNTSAIKKGGSGGGGGEETSITTSEERVTRERSGRSWDQFGNSAAAAAASGMTGIAALVSAIDPSAISTLGDSIGMLAGRIGESFTPFVLQASEALQGMSRWVNGLDASTKSSLASVVSYGVVGLGGLAIAVKVLLPLFGALTTAIRGVGVALMFMTTSPLGFAVASVAAITTGVLALTGVLGKAKDAVVGMGGALGGVATDAFSGKFKPVTEDDVRGIEDKAVGKKVIDSAIPAAERARILDEFVETQKKSLLDLKQTQIAGIGPGQAERERDARQAFMDQHREEQTRLEKERLARGEKSPYGNTVESFDRYVAQQREAMKNAAAEKGIQINADDIAAFTGKQNFKLPLRSAVGDIVAASKIDALGTTIEKLIGPGGVKERLGLEADSEFKQNIRFPVNARYTDASAFRDAAQLAALNTGDAEAERLEQKAEALVKRLDEGNVLLKDIKDGIAEMTKLPFRFGR